MPVRGTEAPTPTFDAPFALTPEASKAPDALQTGLLDAQPEPAPQLGDIEGIVAPRLKSFPQDMTVYHGTPEVFEHFDPDVPPFFAENPEVASKFAMGSKKAVGNSPRVIPVKLNAQRVLDITSGIAPEDAARLSRSMASAVATSYSAKLWRSIRSTRREPMRSAKATSSGRPRFTPSS